MNLFRVLSSNALGRDFVVGDIHGCFDALQALLVQACFDESVDRLLSVGDLVDRGAQSRTVLDWLAKPWFHAVRGNHEQMAIDYHDDCDWQERYQLNGGDWFMALAEAEREPYRAAFAALPLAMMLEVGERTVGIIHADCPEDDWQALPQRLAADDLALCNNGQTLRRECTWSRERFRGEARNRVAGIDLLCVGHSVVPHARQRDNVLYLDTGQVYDGYLSMLCLQDMSLHVLAAAVPDAEVADA